MKMQRGELARTFADKFDGEPPHILVNGNGKGTYLWVGGKNGPCYAHLSGKATLRKLAESILKALDS